MFITSQSPLTNQGGSSATARIIRSLQNNVDVYIIFQTNLRDLRNFLRSFCAAEEFQRLKKVLVDLLAEQSNDDPEDVRTFRNAVLISFNNTALAPYRVRTNVFNLDEKLLRPYLPLTIIDFKKGNGERQQL